MRVAILTPERAKALGVPFISPTAISEWLMCPRKWAYRYIAKIITPSAPSAELGTDAHKQLELYLTKGKPLDFTRPSGEILQAGLHLFPAPNTPGLTGEGEFHLLSERTGFIYMGKKDVELPPGVPQPQLEFDGSAPIVLDLKTTSSIDLYAKKESDLRFDPQTGMYAIDAMVRHACSFADLGWIYCQTKKTKKSKPVTFRMRKDEAALLFDAIESIAVEMHDVRARSPVHSDCAKNPELAAACGCTRIALDFIRTLPPNPAACKAFGGCPYQSHCNLSPSQKARANIMSGNNLIASLRSRVQGTETPKPNEAAPTTDEIPEALKTPYRTPEERAADARAQGDVKVQSDPINPPESRLPPAPLPEKASAEDEKPKKERKPRVKKTEQTKPSADDLSGLAARESAPIQEYEASKAYNVGDRVVVPVVADVGGGGASSVSSNGAMVASASGACAIPFHLYVDCLPEGREIVHADELLEDANGIIVERQKSTEEPVQHYSFLSYGKGKGAIAIALEEVLDIRADLVDVFCSSSSDALPTLTKRAGRITRGVR